MKQLLLFIFLFYAVSLISQTRETVLLEIPLINQSQPSSCWAASLSMIRNYYSPNKKNYYCDILSDYLIRLKNKDTISNVTCGYDKVWFKKNGTLDSTIIYIQPLTNIVDNYVSKYFRKADITIRTDSINFVKSNYRGLLNKGEITKLDSLPWQKIKDNFIIKKSPILTYKRTGYSQSHITIYNGFEHLINNGKQLKLLFVKDPWPYNKDVLGGSEYITTYEFYKKKMINESEYDPTSSLIYNFEPHENSSLKYFLNTVKNSITTKDTINITEKLGKKIKTENAIKIQNENLINHLINSASDSLLKFVGLEFVKTKPFKYETLKILAINNVMEFNIDLINEKGKKIKPKNVYKHLMTLFDQEGSYIIKIKNDTTVTTIISYEITANKELYITRIEKYENSMYSLVSKILPTKSIYSILININNNGQYEYLLIKPKDKKEPILVDLFDKMDYFENPELKASLGAFNSRIHKLKGDKLNKFLTYASPISKTDLSGFKVTQSGLAIIQSCQQLISDSILYRCTNNNLYCKLSTMKAKEYSNNAMRIGEDSLLTFTTYFSAINYSGHTLQNSFNVQWHRFNMDNITTAPGCTKCIPINPHFPFNDSAANDVFHLYFVPVLNYKNLNGNDHTSINPNMQLLSNLAINIKDIKSIGKPMQESKDGYMASHSKEKLDYAGKYSSKGIVCEITLKNDKKVQCYVINDYDGAGGDSGTVKWKE